MQNLHQYEDQVRDQGAQNVDWRIKEAIMNIMGCLADSLMA
jgi:hypothetical protein